MTKQRPPKKKRGRPLTGAEPRRNVKLTLPESVIDRAREIGGSASQGVEVAVLEYRGSVDQPSGEQS